MRKSEVEDSSSSKYVRLLRRHIKGKDNVICKNANYNSAENVKKHSNRRSLPICHHCGITGHNQPKCPRSKLRSRRFRRSCQQELHQALYLLQHFRLHDISSSLFLPIIVANRIRTNQGATRESRRSPLAAMAMKGC
jgi:hypothetical protein